MVHGLVPGFLLSRVNKIKQEPWIKTIYSTNTCEIPGYFLVLKNRIFIVHSEDTFFCLSHVRILVLP